MIDETRDAIVPETPAGPEVEAGTALEPPLWTKLYPGVPFELKDGKWLMVRQPQPPFAVKEKGPSRKERRARRAQAARTSLGNNRGSWAHKSDISGGRYRRFLKNVHLARYRALTRLKENPGDKRLLAMVAQCDAVLAQQR